MNNNFLIAKNTLMLYVRQVAILLVGLYTLRILLNVLGVEDYGIYGVVFGTVSLLSFLSMTMTSVTQRFFSFALGQKDSDKLNKTFTLNFILYCLVALISFVLLETIGLWFINGYLKLPLDRFDAAIIAYHFSALAFIATIFSAPFIAIIVAHEDMKSYAFVSIIEIFLKLGTVFALIYLQGDKLKLYGVSTFIVSVVIAVFYAVTCMRKYAECQFKRFYWDKELFRQISEFTGWTLFGQMTTVLRTQALTIVLNQIFNPFIVAARIIAINIADQINIFSGNFSQGLYPQIIKSYAADNKDRMYTLIFNGSKITFFLMWIFALPLFLEMDMILKIWLKNFPLELVLFSRLALIEVLISTISLPIVTAAKAPGRMKKYELVLGSMQVAIFIISWLILKWGGEAYSIFVVAIIANIIMLLVRLLIVKKLINISLKIFWQKTLVPIIVIAMLSTIFSFVIYRYFPDGIFFVFSFILLSILSTCLFIYLFGVDKSEKVKIMNIIGGFLNK